MAARKSSRPSRSPSSSPSLWTWLGVALMVVLLDQLTKTLIVGAFAYGDAMPVTRYFNLVRVHNEGAAFSFLANAGGWQRWFFVGLGVVTCGLMTYMLRQHAQQKLFALALSLIMGGAVGNVIDRLVYGHVIDFLDFHWTWLSGLFYRGHFPAFNVADCAISVGAALLVLDELRRVKRSA